MKSFSQSEDKKSLTFSFDGLSGDSNYSVSISGIKRKGDSTSLISVFSFVTEHIFEYPEYKASDAWFDSTNKDSIWRWLYRDNQTKDSETQYVEYSISGSGNTNGLGAPKKLGDGTYDYSMKDNTSTTRVFADSSLNPGMRNAMGRYWMRPSVAGSSEPKQSAENRIVKQFSAPESGKVVISTEDMSGAAKIYNIGLSSEGNKLDGAVIRIIKKSVDGKDDTLFEHSFSYTASDCPEGGVGIYDFDDLECIINKGDKIWFEVSSEGMLRLMQNRFSGIRL